ELPWHLFRCRQDEGIRAGCGRFERPEHSVADVDELAHLGEVGADEGEVVPLVEVAEPQDAVLTLLVAQRGAEGVERVGGVCDQSACAQDLRQLPDAAYLRFIGVDVEVPCHGLTLVRCARGFSPNGPRTANRCDYPSLRASRRAASSSIEVISASSFSMRSVGNSDRLPSTSCQTFPTAIPNTPCPPWTRSNTSSAFVHSYTDAPSLISVICARSSTPRSRRCSTALRIC